MTMRDWSGFECGSMLIIRRNGSIADGITKRALWLAIDKDTRNNYFIRSNEIQRKCRKSIEQNTDIGTLFRIQRCQDSSIDYLTDKIGVIYFGRLANACSLSKSQARNMLKRLENEWLGFTFKLELVCNKYQ